MTDKAVFVQFLNGGPSAGARPPIGPPAHLISPYLCHEAVLAGAYIHLLGSTSQMLYYKPLCKEVRKTVSLSEANKFTTLEAAWYHHHHHEI